MSSEICLKQLGSNGMTDISSMINSWLEQAPVWQQEAVERLFAKGDLSDNDIDTIIDLLKHPPAQDSVKPRHFVERQISDQSPENLRLVSIGQIQGIESLSPAQPLKFGDGNLSVIYGPNGSGKSGYTRILRRVCDHPRAEQLRQNIFEATPEQRQCTVAYRLDSIEHEEIWQADAAPIEQLRAVDIFDSETGRFYLSDEVGVTYTPPGLALFAQLSNVCEQVKERLTQEKSALTSALPEILAEFANTPSASSYQSLGTLSGDDIRGLKSWTKDDESYLNKLTEQLNTEDPAQAARHHRNIKSQIDELISRIRAASESLGRKQIQDILEFKRDALAKRRIANEAAQVQSANLDGVGSETWRALWQAARDYSVRVAYRDRDFPVIDDGARCVLCQERLVPDAIKRLQDFDLLIKGELESAASDAEAAYMRALNELPECLDLPAISAVCTSANWDSTFEDWLTEFWVNARQICERLKAGQSLQNDISVALPMLHLNKLQTDSNSHEASARAFESQISEFDRDSAEALKLNLRAKQWIAEQELAIDAEIERIKGVAQYDEWIKSANSRPVSVKAGELAKISITDAYVARFNAELNKLRAGHIRVVLAKTRTRQGVAMHQLKFDEAETPGVSPLDVLSEGERRIISLAAFLADVGDKPYAAPFVFDDPISSLDQDYESAVAVRLAQLASARQVLIFTHRLSLLGAIEDAAKKMEDGWKSNHLSTFFIAAYGGTAGHPTEGGVAHENTKKANNILLEKLRKAVEAGERDGPDAYERDAKIVCVEFRELIERTVEDDLLQKIIKRHRRSVQTDNRLDALAIIKPEDCRLIDELMSRYSFFAHSQSLEAPVLIPGEDAIRKDLNQLKSWRDSFKKRRPESTG